MSHHLHPPPRQQSPTNQPKTKLSSRSHPGTAQHAGGQIAAPGRAVPRRGGDPDDGRHAQLCRPAAGLRVQRAPVSGYSSEPLGNDVCRVVRNVADCTLKCFMLSVQLTE